MACCFYARAPSNGGPLHAVAGNSAGIKIHAVFVSKVSGELLQKYACSTNVELWIIPSFEGSAWLIMAISFISLLAMSAVLATCFFVPPRLREFHGMSSRLVKAMPSLIFTAILEDNCTSRTCAICLKDYNVGENFQFQARHKFRALCVDSWLTSWRTFCPVCKRDARTCTGEPPASESTPLLSSSPVSVASSSALSSARSSVASSSAIQIARASRPPSASCTPSFSSTYMQQSFRSYRQSPPLSISRSSADLQNASSYRSQGFPSNPSASFISSSHQHHPLHHSESAASLSPFVSAQSLPGC
ncbi:hypothetical protein EUGRSUZ_K02156 [Eucalyptus grandis]|uniref:Uncharacterized protein n=2 Tax=Eucalyptus grandis TaxID=71139 RepID=A0ACC3IVM6_EUCGR|nr:hypothetical protein EUGRSUZ_K02156 [Eucalyptus grandis]